MFKPHLGITLLVALTALSTACAENAPEDAPVIRAVDSPAARFDTLAQELLSQPEPPVKTWQLAPQVTNKDVAQHTSPHLSPPQFSSPLPASHLPTLQWARPQNPVPLMRQSLRGANYQAVPAARQIITTRLNNTPNPPAEKNTAQAEPLPDTGLAANSSNDPSADTAVSTLATQADAPKASAKPQTDRLLPPTALPVIFPPLLKVPGWLWGTLAAVFVGVALLAVAATTWLLQRMWLQNRRTRVQKTPASAPVTSEASPSAEPLPSTPPIKPYASTPKSCRAIETRRLLKPTPNNVNEVLSQWVAQVSQARQV